MNSSKMEVVVPFLDGLQRIAGHYHIAIIGSVGSPKQRVGEGYTAKRDSIFGTVAWGRKTETIAVLQYIDGDDMNPRRTLSVLLRNGAPERFDMKLEDGRLVEVPKKPETGLSPQMDWVQAQTDWFTTEDLREGIKVSSATANRYIASARAKGIIRPKTGPRDGAMLYKYNGPRDTKTPEGPVSEDERVPF